MPACTQGDLTDPLYFDYISYAQYAVIGREMPKGQQVFQVRGKLCVCVCMCVCLNEASMYIFSMSPSKCCR